MAGETVLQLEPTAENQRNSEGAFITFADGRIMFVYTRFTGGAGDHATSDLAAVYSEDDGRTWTEPEIIVPNRGDINTMSVSLLRLNDGRILLSYLTKDRFFEREDGNCRPWASFSDDEGATWTEPRLIVSVPGYYVQNNDRIVQLSENHPVAPGRLIAPLALHRHKDYSEDGGIRHDSRSVVLWRLSDDGGETWREAKDWWALPVRSGSGLQEPGLVELKKRGWLFSWARTDTGYQWGTTSRDGGDTWEPFEPLHDFVSPCSPLSIKRIPSTGDLLAVWNDVSGRWNIGTPYETTWARTPLAAALSSDDGETWKNHRLVEDDPDHGYCYIAIHFVGSGDDAAVLLAYCAGGKETKMVLDRLRMRRIPLSWFYGAE